MIWISFLKESMACYENYQRASERWSDKMSSAIYLRLFDRHLARCFPDKGQLTQEMIDSWCSKRSTENNNSCRSRVYPVYSYLRYAKSRGHVEAGLCLPPLPKKIASDYVPTSFTKEELSRFFHATDKLEFKYLSFKRRKILSMSLPVMFRLLYSSGMRTTEVRLLKREQVNLENGVVDIRESKGHAQHFIVLHDTMLELMRKYDRAMEFYAPERTYFFESYTGHKHSASSLSHFFRKIWNEANGTDKKPVPYELRHHFAVVNINAMKGSAMSAQTELTYLSKAMGHRLVESTAYYYSITPALSDVVKDLTEDEMNSIIPDLSDYEQDE